MVAIWAILFSSCSITEGYIEYQSNKYIDFERELLDLLSNNRRLILESNIFFDMTNIEALTEYQRLQYNHNLSVARIAKAVKRGEDIVLDDFDVELRGINYETGLFTNKLRNGEYKYKVDLFPLVDIFLKEISKVFLLDSYARILIKRFTI